YQIRLKDVTLYEGKNEVTLLARNDDAWSLSPGVTTIEYKKPLVPPKITLIEPHSGSITWRKSTYTLRFQIESPEKLQLVEVRRGDQKVGAPILVDKLQKKSQGRFEVSHEVELKPGPNEFDIVAASDGGKVPRPTRVEISTPPQGAWLEIVGLQPPSGPLLKPDEKDGRVTFPAVPTGRATLLGRVVWLDERDEQLNQGAKGRQK